MKLVIGPGKTGRGDKAVDLYPYEGVTDVLDIAVEPLPYDDQTFDEVEASHVLEHLETVIHWKEPVEHQIIEHPDGNFEIKFEWVWRRRFPRVEIMREIYRVLKPGGIAVISVPTGYPNYAQDPTHADVPWTHSTFGYFSNQWGGGNQGNEACLSSGIDFGFQMIKSEYYPEDDERNLTVWLKK